MPPTDERAPAVLGPPPLTVAGVMYLLRHQKAPGSKLEQSALTKARTRHDCSRERRAASGHRRTTFGCAGARIKRPKADHKGFGRHRPVAIGPVRRMPESKIHAAPASPVVCGCGQSNFGAPPAVGAGAKGSFLSIDRGGPNNLEIQ